jgi:ankyrin repeat protein
MDFNITIKQKEVFDACISGDISVINNRIRRKYNLDFVNEEGQTPLIVATINNKLDIVYKIGAYRKNDIDATDYDHCTALFHAVMNNNSEMVELLLELGANFLIMSDGIFPMNHAVMMEYNNIVRILHKYGDEAPNNYLGLSRKRIKREEKFRETTDKLILSIRNNDVEAVRKCIAEGCNVNQRYSPRYTTPIIYATEFGNLEIIKILCENGADIKMTDSIGGNAYLVADINGYDDVKNYFNSIKN